MALDGYVLNGTSLNDETNYGIEAMDAPPPVKRPEWAQAADSDGSSLIRTPLYENRTITLTLRVGPQASMNAALEKIGALNDLLQECEKNPDGSPLVYTPATGTKKYTLYVLTAQITAVPTVNEGNSAGFYVFAPQLTVVLTCKPFAYGTEEEVAAAKSIETGLSTVVLTIPTMAGDVPAEGRLVVKDTSGPGRRFVEWGLEQRYYNASTSLILDSEDMTVVSGAQSTLLNAEGAYKRAGATNGTVALALVPEPVISCTTGNLKHVGTFRVKGRVRATLGSESTIENVYVRLSYQDGEGPFRANTWQTPPLGNEFAEVDLGTITLTEKVTGTQKWSGQLEAYSTNKAATDTLHIDYLTFIPCEEGYGKARGVRSSVGSTVAFDNLTTGTLSGALSGRTSPLGGAWVTGGGAADFAVEAGAITRASATERVGLLGSAFTNMRTTVTFPALKVGGNLARGAIVRAGSETSYAVGLYKTPGELSIAKVSGGKTPFATRSVPIGLIAEALSLTVIGSTYYLVLYTTTGNYELVGTNVSFTSGKGGIYDSSASTELHKYTGISIVKLPPTPFCIQPSHAMEVRSDSTIAEDPTGTFSGPVQEYRGQRFYVPQDGSANRTSRVLVKADRNDLEEADQQTIGDAFTAQVFATPRFCALPR